MKILMAEVNISEGIDLAKVDACKVELMRDNDLELIDLNSNPDHNRSVFTYKGSPESVLAGTKRLTAKAVELIDMTNHTGSHPRMGAVDVVPFIPVKDMTIEDALVVAHDFGKFLGSIGVPAYYYEEAAKRDARKNLVSIRKGGYEALEERMKDPEWEPDEGPKTFQPRCGATVTGVRFPLVAFNINLNTTDIDACKKIVKAVRGATGGYQHVRAIALPLEERGGIIQISMNLTNYEKTPIHRVFETIKSEAASYNIGVVGTELVGPVPLAALHDVLRFYLRIEDSFNMNQIYD